MIEPEQFNAVAGGPFIDLAGQLNKLRRFAISIRPVAGKNTQIQETSHGSMIDASAKGVAAASGVAPELFKVIRVRGDYLVCRKAVFRPELEGDPYEEESATEFKVAKPYKLRQSPFDGKTLDGKSYGYSSGKERTEARGGYIETQVITPAYAVAGEGTTGASNTSFDVIWAINISETPRTDKVFGYSINDDGFNGYALAEWLDTNTDGRAWAVKSSISP